MGGCRDCATGDACRGLLLLTVTYVRFRFRSDGRVCAVSLVGKGVVARGKLGGSPHDCVGDHGVRCTRSAARRRSLSNASDTLVSLTSRPARRGGCVRFLGRQQA